MYEVLDKDTIKFEILPHFSVAKRGYVPKRGKKERKVKTTSLSDYMV